MAARPSMAAERSLGSDHGLEEFMKPVKAYLWDNGMLMVFDEQGEQVPEYQGRGNEKIPQLMKDFPDCNLVGGTWPKP